MTKKMKVPRYTRTQMIRWWRKYHSENITQEEICKRAGCHLSTISRWFRMFDQEKQDAEDLQEDPPDVLTAPTAPSKSNGKKVLTADQQTQPGTTEALLDENSYLRWWNQGERKGYVDRLLKEMS